MINKNYNCAAQAFFLFRKILLDLSNVSQKYFPPRSVIGYVSPSD